MPRAALLRAVAVASSLLLLLQFTGNAAAHRVLVDLDKLDQSPSGPTQFVGEDRNAIVRLDQDFLREAGKVATFEITRQGQLIAKGQRGAGLDFHASDLYKQYIAVLKIRERATGKLHNTCTLPLYIRGANASLCGTQLFSKEKLDCTPVPAQEIHAALSQQTLAPHSDRGFSVEFEFVGRDIRKETWRRFKEAVRKKLTGGGILDHGRAVEFVGDEKNLTDWEKILSLQECFARKIDSTDTLGSHCASDADCSLTQYCLDCDRCLALVANERGVPVTYLMGDPKICGGCATGSKLCKARSECNPRNEDCPQQLDIWNWERDGSVLNLDEEQTSLLGARKDEMEGAPFEVTAPGPPNVLHGRQGMRAVMEMLTTLHHMGTQAGPSQGLHVHINVASNKATGAKLTLQGIASIWAAWAKYQLVIAEMLSPGRQGNYYAKMHVLGDCEIDDSQESCKEDPCPCVKRFFKQMHAHLRAVSGTGAGGENYTEEDVKDFCNAVIRLPGSKYKKPCQNRFPNQRYFAVNLVALAKFGTLEFRCHSASLDPQRIGRWVQFLMGFVEYFGEGPGMKEMSGYFSGANWEADFGLLKEAQQQATAGMLFETLGNVIDAHSQDFYMRRSWERQDKTCEIINSHNTVRLLPQANCSVVEEVEPRD